MKMAMPAMILLLATQAGAQSVVSMGRLFTTPEERAQLDAQRGQLPAAAASPGNDTASASGAIGVPGMSAATTASAPVADTETAQAMQEAPGLRLDGVIRRSHGPTVVIVNGEVQPAPVGGVMRGTVTLQADGRSVVLKPGQRYDPATGEIHEAER